MLTLANRSDMEDRSAAFASARPRLWSIAYRMLGSAQDAEDVVQDAYVRWQEAPEAEIRVPEAYLTTIVTRLAINELQSARRRRETYVGPWLPEPLVIASEPHSLDTAEQAESLSMGFLVLLERLSPVERAVFLLREVFDFEYAEIGRIVDKSEANCRQLFGRAKARLATDEARFGTDPAQADRLLRHFTAAVEDGDMDSLLAILAEDVVLWADGGGRVRGAAVRPVHGSLSVARLITGVVKRFVPADRTIKSAWINGQPGFIVYAAMQPIAALIFEIQGSRIHAIYAIGNPDKLRALPDFASTND
jgi:RNA polymerase sigma-70 factor (ECF subfamily)